MAKDKRNYNVFFNLHTVSGIVITVGLFICFFAGAIALFYKNINNWENNTPNEIKIAAHTAIDYEKALKVIADKGYKLNGRSFDFSLEEEEELGKGLFLVIDSKMGSKERPKPTRRRPNPDQKKNKSKPEVVKKFSPEDNLNLVLDLNSYSVVKDKGPNGGSMLGAEGHGPSKGLGTFIYHLHYLDQIPIIGESLSGFIALFFLIAIITGVLIHWKKIVQNFFTFRLKNSLKNLWTDAHTALGVIGLPFQFMYALTSTLMSLLTIYIMATTTVLFDGDGAAFMDAILPVTKHIPPSGELDTKRLNINDLAAKSVEELHIEEAHTVHARIANYNDKDARFIILYSDIPGKHFYKRGAAITYQLRNGDILSKQPIDKLGFNLGVVISTIQSLHFGIYGGGFLKLIYVLLALITCFVILSGVLIWLEARNNKRYEDKKMFNTNVGFVYFGICMGLYPAIAFFFCITKLLPDDLENRFFIMETCFFLLWLGLTTYAYFLKNIHQITKQAILLGGILAILIPFLNGLHSGLWFWSSLTNGYQDSFYVDLISLLTGIVSILIVLIIKPTKDKAKKKLIY